MGLIKAELLSKVLKKEKSHQDMWINLLATFQIIFALYSALKTYILA